MCGLSGGAGQESQLAVTWLVGHHPLVQDGTPGEVTLLPEGQAYCLITNIPDIAHSGQKMSGKR